MSEDKINISDDEFGIGKFANPVFWDKYYGR